VLACGEALRAGGELGGGRLVLSAGAPARRGPDGRGADGRVSAGRGADERGAAGRVVGRGDRAGGLVMRLL
jgi:hypothetical protein